MVMVMVMMTTKQYFSFDAFVFSNRAAHTNVLFVCSTANEVGVSRHIWGPFIVMLSFSKTIKIITFHYNFYSFAEVETFYMFLFCF
jgi:hypothetical protein